jgi:hypothetical protein
MVNAGVCWHALRDENVGLSVCLSVVVKVPSFAAVRLHVHAYFLSVYGQIFDP